MSKNIWVKARCNQKLKDRVKNYVDIVSATGEKIDESDVVRKALVAYLNKNAPETQSLPLEQKPSKKS